MKVQGLLWLSVLQPDLNSSLKFIWEIYTCWQETSGSDELCIGLNQEATVPGYTSSYILYELVQLKLVNTNSCNTKFLITQSWFLDPKHVFYIIFFLLKVPGPIASIFFSNFRRFWYQKKAHIFLITPVKFYSWKMYRLKDINENVTSYGNHN